jgi:hypothetical protein
VLTSLLGNICTMQASSKQTIFVHSYEDQVFCKGLALYGRWYSSLRRKRLLKRLSRRTSMRISPSPRFTLNGRFSHSVLCLFNPFFVSPTFFPHLQGTSRVTASSPLLVQLGNIGFVLVLRCGISFTSLPCHQSCQVSKQHPIRHLLRLTPTVQQ